MSSCVWKCTFQVSRVNLHVNALRLNAFPTEIFCFVLVLATIGAKQRPENLMWLYTSIGSSRQPLILLLSAFRLQVDTAPHIPTN